MSSFYLELSIVMLLVLGVSFIMHKIKQPLLIGYIFSGLIAGPLFLNILSSNEGYQTFSHIGIALLLFIVGLHLNLKLIKEVGIVSLVTGIGQVLFTSIVGFLISYFLGFSVVASLLIAVCLTFSSTIIIVKLLSDKKDLDTLYGKISMGFLIVQDLIAVIILMSISIFLAPKDQANTFLLFFRTGGIIIFSILFTYLLSKFVLPKLLKSISKSTELLFIFVISWCLGISAFFDFLGFSLEVGALLAGVALASSPYQFEISSKIRPLRDFFIVMFFILLGSQMVPPIDNIENMSFTEKMSVVSEEFSSILVPAIILSLFVLIGNPLIVLILMGILGYSSRTGFLSGLTVAQISEFGLILAMLGVQAGFLNNSELAMITLVGIITITGSTYLILNGNFLYKKLERVLKFFEKKNIKDKDNFKISSKHYEIIIFGYDRIGYSLLKSLDKLNKEYLVVDYDPEVIKKLKSKKINCLYGDAGNIDLLEDINFDKTKLIISTIPDYEINSLILSFIKEINRECKIILTAENIDSALNLYKEKSDYVIIPHFLGGKYISTLIEENYDTLDNILKEKIKHINDLEDRKKANLNLQRKNRDKDSLR